MKFKKKYLLFSVVEIVAFVFSCFFASLSKNYRIDVFCNNLISYTKYSTVDAAATPLLSISSKKEKFDYKDLFSSVNYNQYVPYYRCSTDTLLNFSSSADSIGVSVISQPTFWSTPYTTSNGETIFRLDHSSYYLKYQSEYNSHGYNAFFYLSQSLASHICKEMSISEETLIGRVFEFKDKNDETMTAYVSNIVVDGYGLSDYQTHDKGFFVLSFLLFDPKIKNNFNAYFDIKMKGNSRGNSKIIEACLGSCPRSDYCYDFYTFSKSNKEITLNQDISEQFQTLDLNDDYKWVAGVVVFGFLFMVAETAKAIFRKKYRNFVLTSSAISAIIFGLFGIVCSFIYVFYLFGFFSLIYFAIDSIFILIYAIGLLHKKYRPKSGGNILEQSSKYYEIKI